MGFKECVFNIKEIYEKTNVLDNLVKLDVIRQNLRLYFEEEEPEDVFEGFVRMCIFLDRITTFVAKQHDLSLVKIALLAYAEFVRDHPILDEKPKAIGNQEILLQALKILSDLKFKHAQMISAIFHLKNAIMKDTAVEMINAILAKEDFPKAIQWMALLNLRDQFHFEEIAGTLILEHPGMLEMFIGDAEYRRKKLIHFLNKIIECHWRHQSGYSEIETRLIADYKKIQKLTVRLIKHYELHDSEAPYIMISRAYDALLYNHYAWHNGERSWNSFEEVALPSINGRSEIRNRYFNFLCDRGLGDKALHFAQLINLAQSEFPASLQYYCQEHPNEFSSVREKIAQNIETQLRNEQIEQENICQLDNGQPIILVDTMEKLQELIAILRNGKEKLIGIDAEWRPHYLTTSELVSLIQIATSKGVYLVDVLVLDEKAKMVEDDWLNFFDALFCTENVRKIGYDFTNDIRVFKSTFAFVTKIFPTANNVICMYKLIKQVMLMPEARSAVFGSIPPKDLGLSLSDMARFFTGTQLEKSERIGNWSKRPLRLEQMKYAAMDAYCLVEIYKKISAMIRRLRPDQQDALQNCALIKLSVDEKQRPCVLQDGQVVRVKEGEDDFVSNIQKVTEELMDKVTSSDELIKSIDEVRFVADSMLFGLGKNLRKCGFDTRLIGDRKEIVEFCREENNSDFIVLTTGKAHKQLEVLLSPERILFVPISTHTGAVPPSMLVNHVIREMKIAIRPQDMWSRCVDCNKRAFIRIPTNIVHVIFFMNVVRHGADWLEITEMDLQDALKKLRDETEMAVHITEQMNTGEEPRQNRTLLEEEKYYLYEDKLHIICETRNCAVDIMNKLMLVDGAAAPFPIHVGLKYKKNTFEQAGLQFFVCTECGKVQFNSSSSEN